MLFDKHPLSNYSKPLKVWIDGNEYFDRSKDVEARAEFAKKKKALMDKEAAAAKKQHGNEGVPAAMFGAGDAQ